jgi:hypothetical protein
VVQAQIEEAFAMDTTDWIILAVAVGVLAVAAIAAFAYMGSRRSTGLRDRFGPEYDRTVGEAGSRREAERELRSREERYAELQVKPLSEASRTRYTEDWDHAERLFVDDPELAAREADRLVRNVLDERGYPNDDLETQTAAVSVEHPRAVQRYRHGHDMVHANGSKDGDEQRTENLRKAMVDFRAVFVEMVEPEMQPAAR